MVLTGVKVTGDLELVLPTIHSLVALVFFTKYKNTALTFWHFMAIKRAKFLSGITDTDSRAYEEYSSDFVEC